jgi:tetratricopeptide (TPR) repeat protein
MTRALQAGTRIIACAIVATALSGCESPTRPNEPMTPGIAADQREAITNAHREAKRASRESDPGKAEMHYRRAVAYYNDYAPAWNNLGVTLMEQERFMEANEAFERAGDLAPSDPRPAYNQGLLFFRRSYPREALPHFLRALERDPHFLPALRAAVQAEVRIRETSQDTLDRIRRALLLETDPKWQQFFQLQRNRIQAELGSTITRRLGLGAPE